MPDCSEKCQSTEARNSDGAILECPKSDFVNASAAELAFESGKGEDSPSALVVVDGECAG